MGEQQYDFDPAVSSAVSVAELTRPAQAARAPAGPLSAEQLRLMNRYWSAANYLTVGQIYLQDNPLLREPLRPEHIKPRLLGHWGTSPGLSLIYAHVSRLIRLTGQPAIYLAGPGHGGGRPLPTTCQRARRASGYRRPGSRPSSSPARYLIGCTSCVPQTV